MDVERGRKVDSIDGPPLAKIKESPDSLHFALEGQYQFGIYQIDDDTLSELEQQVDFVDIPYNIPTLKDRYPIPNPDSFTQNYDAIVGSRRGRAKFRLNQAFTGNRKMATDLNRKIDIIYIELMRKFDALSEHIKRLDGQVTENATTIKRETGRLPGRTDANPKSQVNVVLLRSGKRFIPSTIDIDNVEKRAEVEKTSEIRSRPIILNSPNPESETPREKEQSNTEGVAIDLEEEEEELEEDVEIDRQDGTNVDRPTTVNIDRQEGNNVDRPTTVNNNRHNDNNVDRRSTPAKPTVERVYRTLPPFPPNKTQTKRELDKAIYKKAFDKITLEMPLSDAIKVSSSIKKYVKDMMYERRTKRRFDVGGSSTAPPPPPVRDQYPWLREREDEPIPLFYHFEDTHKAAKSSACRNHVIEDTWDDYDIILYNEWLKVSIKPTRFVDPDVIRALGIKSDLEDLFEELGMGNMATHPHVLYPDLVRQFMATVNVYYASERAKRANEGVLTFFIRGIRYKVPLSTLYTIYGFENERQHAIGMKGNAAQQLLDSSQRKMKNLCGKMCSKHGQRNQR
ncbi:hypothetical protein F2Q70_00013712 [Brassica cretica]|uniref:Arabidopsis retrotransposon Orf1 C-terminal domain-containing protein n=1 Tax=Brassica cretica TaxID=69181 RepID=A0A8S9LT35_BRACR|nr:hypothetical protein F2Q70_00013712 [Brassica cretica]